MHLREARDNLISLHRHSDNLSDQVHDVARFPDELTEGGNVLALVLCDHRMPGTTGVEFLVQMMDDDRTPATRKVLLTGQAQLHDTVRALNEANLDHHIAKPWDVDELHQVVRTMLTDYVGDMDIDPLPYLDVLDATRAMDLVRRR